MIKYFCDKCGKEIGEFEAYTVLVEAPEIKSWADQYMYERRGYQVCRDCMAKVTDFIEPKPRKKFEDEPQTDCKRCRHFATDNCRECYGNELFEESGYIIELTNTPQTERSNE